MCRSSICAKNNSLLAHFLEAVVVAAGPALPPLTVSTNLTSSVATSSSTKSRRADLAPSITCFAGFGITPTDSWQNTMPWSERSVQTALREKMESASDARRGFVTPGTEGDSLQAANSAMVNWVGGGDSHRVLVVVDAAKDQHSSTALDWTLDHAVQRGDDLRLLAVLQQIYNPSKGGFQGGLSKLGYKSWADEKGWNGVNRSVLDTEITTKKQSLQNNLDLLLRCQKLGVTLEIDVQVSRDLKTLVVEEAKSFGAHHVVLERSTKKDKKHYIDNLTCYVTRVKSLDVCEPLRPGLPQVMMQRHAELPPIPPVKAQDSVPGPGALIARSNGDIAAAPSHRRSSASSFMSCLADSDLLSIQGSEADEVVETDVESEHEESTVFGNRGTMEDSAAVRQWLRDHGSPEHAIYPREESLQLSTSPSSDIVSPSTEASLFPINRRGNPESTENQNKFPAQDTSPAASEDSPGSTIVSSSSLSTESMSMVPSVRPVASTIPPATNSLSSSMNATPVNFPSVGRPDHLQWSSPVDNNNLICDPRNGNSNGATQQGPISVQPRRVDASWTLHGLNGLLNGDHHGGRNHHHHHQQHQPKHQHQQHQNQQHQLQHQHPQHAHHAPAPPEKALQIGATMGRVKKMENVGMKLSSPSRGFKHTSHSPHHEIAEPMERTSSVRRAVFMKKQGPMAPPLCTICKHKAPEFGKPVRKFTYTELSVATDSFNHHNYLAQGGYGSVYRGILPEGQLIAVKQHKIASSQGDHEFCAEVEVLSCAQHRNLVTLIGYCVENQRRLLVYEYVCNGSLDRHLSAKNKEGLQWKYRQKIALGAARALRYLHEECRVGCIVHRDMRPNNILLTHDFTPMVGDFGLARRQMNGEMAEETRVLGTLGYVAPEYAQTGQITEKADVYAFGVVLLEIITGRKAVDHQGARGGILLTEWARPLLDNPDLDQLVDPRLKQGDYDVFEMYCMMHAARQCIKKDPGMRPRMTQVLRILDPAQDNEAIYGPGMGGRKITPDILPAYTAPVPPTPDYGPEKTPDYGKLLSSPTSVSDTQSDTTTSFSGRTAKQKLSSKSKKSSKMMFKTSRSSSAPRLSYDEERNLEDEDDGFKKDGVLLSYNSMLEFV